MPLYFVRGNARGVAREEDCIRDANWGRGWLSKENKFSLILKQIFASLVSVLWL